MECLISYNGSLIFVLNAAYYIGCHIVSGLPVAVGCNLLGFYTGLSLSLINIV